MDVFDDDYINQLMNTPKCECITSYDVLLGVFALYSSFIIVKLARRIDTNPITHFIEWVIIQNLKNGSYDDAEEHSN